MISIIFSGLRGGGAERVRIACAASPSVAGREWN